MLELLDDAVQLEDSDEEQESRQEVQNRVDVIVHSEPLPVNLSKDENLQNKGVSQCQSAKAEVTSAEDTIDLHTLCLDR